MKTVIITISLIFFSISTFVFAQEKSFNPLPVNPTSDAEYQSLIKEYTLHPDGSMDYRFFKKQKLNTYRAFQNLYGETFIVYNPVFQKLIINDCFTVMADGKKVKAPENAINEILPAFAAGAPAFNSLREMVITHTALERGATINLDYTLHTNKGNAPALMGNEILAESEPVKDLTVSVKIPTGSQLYFKLINSNLLPVKTVENNFQVFTWQLNDIPAFSPEEFQKSNYEAYPRLLFSTSGSKNDVVEYLTAQAAFGLKISDAMKIEISQLQNDNPDNLSLALKIQEKVINEIKLWPVPLRYTGYRCRTPEETWNSMGGNLAEKAILLSALLKSSGINADPVAISRSVFFDEKLGTLADIEDFAVRIEMKDAGIQYLSLTYPNNLNLGQVYAGKVFIRLGQNEKPEYARSGDPGEKITMNGTFLVSSDPKLTGEISLQLDGAVNPYLGLIRDKNKMKNLLSGGISKADLKEIKISQSAPETAFQTYTVLCDKPFRKDSSWFYFNLPCCSSGVESWGIKTLSSKRSQPLEIPYSAEENYEYNLTLPAGLTLFSPSGKIELKNKAGSYYYELRQEGNKINICRKIKIRENNIPVENYADFKTLMDNWNNPKQREIIFQATR